MAKLKGKKYTKSTPTNNIHFAKYTPFYYGGKIIESKGMMRLSKLEDFYLVEDQFTASKYKTLKKAKQHFDYNVKIDKEFEKIKSSRRVSYEPYEQYPNKPSTSLSAISKRMFKIPYHETSDSQMRKVKIKFRELNK